MDGEKEASERFDNVIVKGRDFLSQNDLLKYIRSKFERLSLRNIESHQETILPMQEGIIESRR